MFSSKPTGQISHKSPDAKEVMRASALSYLQKRYGKCVRHLFWHLFRGHRRDDIGRTLAILRRKFVWHLYRHLHRHLAPISAAINKTKTYLNLSFFWPKGLFKARRHRRPSGLRSRATRVLFCLCAARKRRKRRLGEQGSKSLGEYCA